MCQKGNPLQINQRKNNYNKEKGGFVKEFVKRCYGGTTDDVSHLHNISGIASVVISGFSVQEETNMLQCYTSACRCINGQCATGNGQ